MYYVKRGAQIIPFRGTASIVEGFPSSSFLCKYDITHRVRSNNHSISQEQNLVIPLPSSGLKRVSWRRITVLRSPPAVEPTEVNGLARKGRVPV